MPERALPRVSCPARASSAQTRADALHGHAVPVAGVAGDQQAALFGQACVDPGMGKNTYGTGSFVLLNTGFSPPEPPPGLLATVAWSDRRLDGTYALEASIFATGAAVQWLRDGLGSSSAPRRPRRSRQTLEGNDGVYFVPALTGLGSPHWDPYARGTIVGLTRGSGARPSGARDARGDRLPDASTRSARWRPPPGSRSASCAPTAARRANAWLMQFQADVLGVPVVLPRDRRDDGAGRRTTWRASAWGCGRVSDVRDAWRERRRYEPRMGEDERATLLAGWADALGRARSGG